jgi:hypothetical protein
MSKLLLDGYRPIKKRWPVYSLDDESGELNTQWFENQKAGAKSGPKSGLGDHRKIGGLLHREVGFFALYATDDSLYLWLNGKCIDVLRDDVVVKRSVDLLLRKRFRVYSRGQLVFDCRYSYLDYEDFPDEDIFWHMARSLKTQEKRLRTLLIWRDKANGNSQPTDEYARNLKDRVSQMMLTH